MYAWTFVRHASSPRTDLLVDLRIKLQTFCTYSGSQFQVGVYGNKKYGDALLSGTRVTKKMIVTVAIGWRLLNIW